MAGDTVLLDHVVLLLALDVLDLRRRVPRGQHEAGRARPHPLVLGGLERDPRRAARAGALAEELVGLLGAEAVRDVFDPFVPLPEERLVFREPLDGPGLHSCRILPASATANRRSMIVRWSFRGGESRRVRLLPCLRWPSS